MPAANLGGYTKRVTATAFVFLAYCVGNIIGPHAFLSSEAPIYQTGCWTILGCTVGQVATAAALRLLLIRRNKKRDEARSASGYEMEAELGILDITDFENQNFRYTY